MHHQKHRGYQQKDKVMSLPQTPSFIVVIQLKFIDLLS